MLRLVNERYLSHYSTALVKSAITYYEAARFAKRVVARHSGTAAQRHNFPLRLAVVWSRSRYTVS